MDDPFATWPLLGHIVGSVSFTVLLGGQILLTLLRWNDRRKAHRSGP
jgi:hypothetical protein